MDFANKKYILIFPVILFILGNIFNCSWDLVARACINPLSLCTLQILIFTCPFLQEFESSHFPFCRLTADVKHVLPS